MPIDVFERLARCRPVNKQSALVTGGGVKEPEAWNDDVLKYNAEKVRRQQQEAFNRVSNQYVSELNRAAHGSHGNFYAKDYAKFAKRRIRRGEWSPSIDETAPKKWVPRKVRNETEVSKSCRTSRGTIQRKSAGNSW
jgi:hypothetical protein